AWCAAMVVIVVAGTLLGASPVFGIAAAACFAVAGYFVVERYKDKRAEQMRESVPDVLRSMGVCFHAGFTLLQTFRQIATEIEGPLGSLFSRAAHELETGISAEEVLVSFRDQASIPELSFVAVALKVQHDAGGSMAAILDAARDSVQGEIELKRSLKVQTAQAKLSARVVTALPFVLIALFSLITEDFLAPFFSSAVGLILLAVAVAMQVTGVLIVRGMLNVGCD
ncbi:MAG: type II secretion system F family protein, partial [Raoultibacter sp.]